MSVSVVASLRPPPPSACRRCHAANTRLLFIRLRAVMPLQRRHQSSLQSQAKDEPPRLSLRQFAGRAIVAGARKLRYAFTPGALRKAYRDYPYSTVLGLCFLFCFSVVWVVVVVQFVRTFYSKELSVYPEPIANSLRRAIHATIIRPNPEVAQKYYRKALEQCSEMGLDPFSDEVLGIRIRIAAWLEQISHYGPATLTLEALVTDCLKWISVMEQAVKDGKVSKQGHYIAEQKAAACGQDEAGDAEPTPAGGKAMPPPPETLWHKRERLLAKAVSSSVKLGELYADEHVLDPEKSHEHLIWAVETSLKEFQRRRVAGTKPGEEHWLTPAELGGSIESLARGYARKAEYQFVIPLYFHALRLCEDPCHRVVIMNNLSAAFAQHPLYSPAHVSGEEPDADMVRELLTESMPRTRQECLEAAQNWASNAYTHAQEFKGAQRTPECDEACAVALCNWGDVAAMLGKPAVARKKFQQSLEMSSQLGFAEGVKKAEAGLAGLTSTSTSTGGP